ncbi:hypothetical protein MYX84_12020 [Acidobacteria bacterium AH-259-O06]|nr:hypothetical protein [Acidobacteria bacterium AH-259-O06]
MMKRIFTITVLLTCGAILFAQSPNSWRGLILDQFTIKDTTSVLGKPYRVKENQKLKTEVGDWIGKKTRYEKLEFKVEGVDKASLYFLKGILKVIEIDLDEKINPNSLESAYGIGFVPKVSGLDIAFKPRDFERNQGKIYPKSYPSVYHLIGVADSAYVVAVVGNAGIRSAFRSVAGVPDDSMSFPGKVETVQLISKSLTDTSGLEALK